MITDLKPCVFAVLLLVSGVVAIAPADEGDPLPPEAVVRLVTDKEPAAKRNGTGRAMFLAISPDSKLVATGENYIVRIFERTTGREVRSFPVEKHQVSDLAFTPDGKGLLVCVAYHPARLWNLETGKETRSFDGAMGSVRGVWRVSFNADASLLALAVPEPAIHLVNPANGQTLKKLGTKQMIDRIAFSPDGRTLAGGGFNRALLLWDVTTGKELWTAGNPSGPILAVAFSSDGKQIATGDSSAVKLWNAENGRMLHSMSGASGAVRTVAFSPDGRLVAGAGDGNDAVIYEAATGTELRRLKGHKDPIWSLAFSPDGQTLVTGSHDTTALVWDITGRKFVKLPAGPVTDAELQQLWADLAKVEGTTGYHAVWKMILLDKKAVPFLDGRMRVTELSDAKVVARLIANLDHEDFAMREDALKALARHGQGVAGDLRKALTTNPSAEMKARLETLLRPILDNTGDPRLRAHRVLTVLEHISAREGRILLEHLADKGPDDEIRREATAALKRARARSNEKAK